MGRAVSALPENSGGLDLLRSESQRLLVLLLMMFMLLMLLVLPLVIDFVGALVVGAGVVELFNFLLFIFDGPSLLIFFLGMAAAK